MKPDWKDAPDFARYLAKDKSGRWTWFEEEPYIGMRCWIPSHGRMRYVVDLHDEPDWRDTLEERVSKEVVNEQA